MVNGQPGGTGQIYDPMTGQNVNGNGITGNVPGVAQSMTSGVPAQNNPYAQSSMPGQPGAPPAGAASLINQLLTSPRPGGLNGLATGGAPGQTTNSPFGAPAGPGQAGVGTAAQSNSPFGSTTSNTGTPVTGTMGQQIGGGIAGVATKVEGEGIKIYNDRSKYKEWEFIYDLSKDNGVGGQQRVQQGQQPQQNGLNGIGSPIGSPNPFGTSSQQSSPFGGPTQSGFGSQTPSSSTPVTTPSTPQQ
jgi:hypothetical protein